MTRSAEPESQPRERGLGSDWRAEAAAAQQAAVAGGETVVTCPAPFGSGGLGRHLQEIVEATGRRGQLAAYIGEGGPAPAPGRSARPSLALAGALALAPLARHSAAWRAWAASVAFDAYAARRLPHAQHLIAFNGTAEAQLRLAPRLGYESRSLVAANSHFRRVMRQHALAQRQYPLEAPWARHLLGRNLREYALAERIYVSSRYVRESFVEEGFSDERLQRFPLTPDPRFEPPSRQPHDSPAAAQAASSFDVVYVGALTVHKGVPLLVDAFRRAAEGDMRLLLLGGWKTRGMRRFLERACAEDPRISVCPGDPLPVLRRARLYVHAAYEDGFAYAPAEALACGVPVLASADTGMKELIEARGGGLVLPTGDLATLTEAIRAAHRGELHYD
jgi:glycosyltransferase involved in cell wall biosynthesis